MKNEKTYRGKVVEALRGAEFRIEFPEKPDTFIRCYMAGRMYKNHISVLIGDEVECVMTPDWSLGRIIKRF